jgi:hypothetical protein
MLGKLLSSLGNDSLFASGDLVGGGPIVSGCSATLISSRKTVGIRRPAEHEIPDDQGSAVLGGCRI